MSKTKLTFINKETGHVIVNIHDTPLVEFIGKIEAVVTRGEKELYQIENGRYMWDLATAFHIIEGVQ